MRFDEFIALSSQLAAADLPGALSHDAILPGFAKERKQARQKDSHPRISGVAAIVYPVQTEAHILLIERQSYKGVHSAQISFPGGKAEEEDSGTEQTARREMEEEVGIPRTAPQLIRQLSEVYIPPSRFLVHPYLFSLASAPQLTIQEREVQSTMSLPLASLLNDEIIETGKIEMSNGMTIRTPYYSHEGHKIWGATAMMLSEIKQLIKDHIE